MFLFKNYNLLPHVPKNHFFALFWKIKSNVFGIEVFALSRMKGDDSGKYIPAIFLYEGTRSATLSFIRTPPPYTTAQLRYVFRFLEKILGPKSYESCWSNPSVFKLQHHCVFKIIKQEPKLKVAIDAFAKSTVDSL